jgi:ABC-type Zn uptake system ZnuABC Zn-binding protein ZnuA
MSPLRLVCVSILVPALLHAAAPSRAEDKLFVVTSTGDMADFVRQVGGDRVDVYPVSEGLYDLHFFEPLPSQVMKLRRADLLVVGGLDIDVWIQGLIDASGNPRIQFGAAGYVDPSVGVRPLQVPQGRIDGSMGDVHPYGNPHFWFTPENVAIAVNNITEGLIRTDPQGKAVYQAGRNRYLSEVRDTFQELRKELAPYHGTAVLQYHPSWDYFCETFGLNLIGALEPKPGIPPTPGHLREIVKRARADQARLLLVEPYYPKRPVNFVVRETGVTALRLPLYVGGKQGIRTYLENLRYLVHTIEEALRKNSPGISPEPVSRSGTRRESAPEGNGARAGIRRPRG